MACIRGGFRSAVYGGDAAPRRGQNRGKSRQSPSKAIKTSAETNRGETLAIPPQMRLQGRHFPWFAGHRKFCTVDT